MTPGSLVEWALCIGIAWLVLASLTGVDEFVKKQFGAGDKKTDLEQRIEQLEKRLDAAEKTKSENPKNIRIPAGMNWEEHVTDQTARHVRQASASWKNDPFSLAN